MNNLSKRNSLIAIIISLVIMLASALGIALFPGFGSVKAAEYNYGEFNENGYYELNGVVFYGVKIKWTSDAKAISYTKRSPWEAQITPITWKTKPLHIR